ncbi:MAG: hypothetical protein ACK4K7_15755 [Allosphingosinicella sp.]|uniref:hypothetical protein n=1 Tax=Allosphingosinicella sp. TaxID=2823234 RepID=UPI00395B1D04
MVFKGFVTAAASVALMAGSTVAAAQSAPVAAPAVESVEEGSEMFGRGGFVIPLIAIIAIILGILAATRDGSDKPPVSP